LIFYH
jgi:clathrin heavy chain